MRKELSFDDDGRPVLITAAAVSVEEQHRARVRRYLTIMAFRIPALIGAAWAYSVWHNGWVSLAILAASIPLPWMAVLIANDRPPRKAEEPRRYGPQTQHPALSPPADRRAIDPASAPHPHPPPQDSADPS
ncbi:DUF3099 domain-containing protein [Mycobacteroides abscessus]|uniref:DUF3099 domain-containing protein n=1 Tax=Mycobacteroides abscessus TaxID=36809 RepID=UPI0011A83CE2|nr:DUF3099 domain-containing protein [Mycobacteroides abscessus]